MGGWNDQLGLSSDEAESPGDRECNIIMKSRRSNGDKILMGSVSSNTKTKPPKERPMNETKYIGMDVHMATTVIAVLNSVGKVVAEAIIETKASAILDFLKSQWARCM